jgi:hypothetical protein
MNVSNFNERLELPPMLSDMGRLMPRDLLFQRQPHPFVRAFPP